MVNRETDIEGMVWTTEFFVRTIGEKSKPELTVGQSTGKMLAHFISRLERATSGKECFDYLFLNHPKILQEISNEAASRGILPVT